MISHLKSIKNLVKNKSYHIDHTFFRLHYQATVGLLLAFCLILTAKILFGDVIDCHSRVMGRDPFYDQWCYSRGTFTEYVIDRSAYQLAVLKRNQTAALIATHNDTALKPVTPIPTYIATTTEAPSLVTRAFDIIYKGIYGQDTTPAPRLARTITNSSIPQVVADIKVHVEVVNETDKINAINSPFPIGLLKGTNLGETLKNQFRRLHKFVKNSGVSISSDLVYIIPGVPVPGGYDEKNLLTFWHFYYQYMPVILFVQAVLFYFPHYLWKSWESGVITAVCKQLYDNRFTPSNYLDSNYHIVDYLQNSFLLKKSLVYKYYFCHLLLLANLILQIIILNVIFNNQFVTYGLDVLQYYFIDEDVYGMRDYFTHQPADLNNPMDFVFPKVTTCRYVVLSAAANAPDEHSFSCVLPLNIFHDKFFLLLWFWLLFLTVLTVCQIIYDIMYATLPILRKQLFIRRFGSYLRDNSRHPTSLPELFLLDLIGTNSDQFAFSALLRKLSKEE